MLCNLHCFYSTKKSVPLLNLLTNLLCALRASCTLHCAVCIRNATFLFRPQEKKYMGTNISTWQPNVKSPIFNQSPVRIYERINECYSICVIFYLAVFAIFGFLCVSDDLVLSRCSWIFFWHNLIFFSRLKVICFIYMLIWSVVFDMIGLLYFMTLIRILSIFVWPFQVP